MLVLSLRLLPLIHVEVAEGHGLVSCLVGSVALPVGIAPLPAAGGIAVAGTAAVGVEAVVHVHSLGGLVLVLEVHASSLSCRCRNDPELLC